GGGVLWDLGGLVKRGVCVWAGWKKKKGSWVVGVWGGGWGRGGETVNFSRSAAEKEARRESGISQTPCEQGRGGRFAGRPRHTE
ncbi:hypothetical protein CWI45_05960, partial [Neisseria meningitidis]